MDLLADIGGTNARIAFRADNRLLEPVHLRRTADFPSLGALLKHVIADAGAKPTRAALAVAGPVVGDHIRLTNLPWSFSAPGLAGELGVERLAVENDVAAMAWAVAEARAEDVVTLTPGVAPGAGSKIVVAPGTGLGMAALAPAGKGRWIAVPSEGGHAYAAPSPALTPEQRRAIWTEGRVHSWEDLVSGIGLPRLYQCLGGGPGVPSETISARAAAGEAAARATLDAFSSLLGAFAGDAAMIAGARAGCYIAGGLLPSLGAQFRTDLFLTGFRAKERFTDYVSTIPVFMLKHPHAALLGLAYFLDQNL